MNHITNRTTAMPRPRPNLGVSGHFADECSIPHCDGTRPEGIGISLCRNHLRKAWAAYELVVDEDEPARTVADRDIWSDDARGTVYFARVGELIKIGWTHNLPHRLSQLSADALLHSQPGTRRDERALHGKFADDLAKGKEWFRQSESLVDYIRELQSPSVE